MKKIIEWFKRKRRTRKYMAKVEKEDKYYQYLKGLSKRNLTRICLMYKLKYGELKQ